MKTNYNCFIYSIFTTCTYTIFFVNYVKCEYSVEVDYGNDNSTSYEYDEDSTIEKLTREDNSTPKRSPWEGPRTEHFGRPRMIPLYDKEGRRLSSQEVFKEVHGGEITNIYYDSEGKRVTLPVLLRDDDFNRANLTSLIEWIEWTEGMKSTLRDMEQKAKQCSEAARHSHEALRGYKSSSHMLMDIEDAIKVLEKCEKKLHEHLRDPSKKWNYSAEKKIGAEERKKAG